MGSLKLPENLLIEAVRLSSIPLEIGQEGHPAIEHITCWWNHSAEPDRRSAYSFALYVKYYSHWFSGNPEEHWVSATAFEKNNKSSVKATALDGKVTLIFFTKATDNEENGYAAPSVDGSEGASGARWAGMTGNAILTADALEILTILPERFADVWALLPHSDAAKR
jgi:hypothetical protein